MRTYILMLCAVVVMAGCGKEKAITPIPQTEQPENYAGDIDTLPDSYSGGVMLWMERNIFFDSTTVYSGSSSVTSGPPYETVDPGQITYDDIPLSKNIINGDIFYIRPTATTPMTEGKKWKIPANDFFHAVTFPDTVSFPTLNMFSDTLKKSAPFTVSFSDCPASEILIDFLPYGDPANDIHEVDHSDNDHFTFSLTQLQKNYVGDSIYIHVYAHNYILMQGDKLAHKKTTHWGKWVRVVE